jgi:uncharacterized membrane protein YraQ (UPF0718 family)
MPLMVKLKGLRNLGFFLFFVLFPCILSSVLVEFAQDIKEFDFLSSSVSGGETSESGGPALLISESFLFCGQPLIQTRARFNRIWRQFLCFIIFALFLKGFSKVMIGKYYLHNYFPKKFFHSLLISFLLGGRAPPSF